MEWIPRRITVNDTEDPVDLAILVIETIQSEITPEELTKLRKDLDCILSQNKVELVDAGLVDKITDLIKPFNLEIVLENPLFFMDENGIYKTFTELDFKSRRSAFLDYKETK